MRKVIINSCSAVMWCRVSALRKMVTFFARPFVSILPPFTVPLSGKNCAQPNADVAEQHAARHVQHTHPTCATASHYETLVLEGGKRRVAAENPHNQEKPPVRMRLQALRQQRAS